MIQAIFRKKDYWVEGFLWLFFSSIGGLLPTWGLFLFLKAFSQTIELEKFTKNGEFALYSASMASAAIYIVMKDYLPKKIKYELLSRSKTRVKATFPGQTSFVVVCTAILVFTSLMFSAVALAQLPEVGLSLNVKWMSAVTIIVFCVTLILSLIITIIDNDISGLSEVEANRLFAIDDKKLEAKFDALRDEEEDD